MLFTVRRAGAAGAVCDALGGSDYVNKLEGALSASVRRSVVAVNTPDAAIHTALWLCGVKCGDYVFCPSYTFYSYVTAVVNAGGVPVFIDCERVTRCMSPLALETALVWAKLQSKLPAAIIIDNAFGSVADYDRLLPLIRSEGVPVIELCLDALFGEYNGRRCGTNGDVAVFAFNKLIKGAGGAVAVCSDEDALAARRFVRAEYSSAPSFDYAMPDIVAALDYAQLGDAQKLAERAKSNLAAVADRCVCAVTPVAGDAGRYALCKTTRMGKLRESGFTVKRPPAVHTLPAYRDCHYFEHEKGYSVSEEYAAEYALVDMDFSPLRLRKLVSLLLCD